MKRRLLLLCCGLLVAALRSPGQTADDPTADGPVAPPGSTVITSNELHSDQVSHVSVFTGNVVVTGTNFRMTCREMTVNFTKDNKVDTIVATGDVVITQPDRVTHCGRAQYYREDDKFVLTEQPSIVQGKGETLNSPTIIIYRTTKQMETGGGRTTLTLPSDSMGSPKADATNK